jgi:hypothetical protein
VLDTCLKVIFEVYSPINNMGRKNGLTPRKTAQVKVLLEEDKYSLGEIAARINIPFLYVLFDMDIILLSNVFK